MVTRVPADVGPARSGSSNRWKSTRRVAEWLGRRRVVGRRVEQGGVLEHHERVPRQVGGQTRGPFALPDQRQHGELLDGLDGALAGRIEDAQRLDLVAEELRPHRPLVGGREDVDDAAPQAPLPDLRDGVDALIACPLESFEQRLALDALAGGQGQGPRAELAGRQQGQRQRRRGRHHRHRLAGQESVAAEGALRIVLAMAAAVPRDGLLGGELEHPARRRQARRVQRTRRARRRRRRRRGRSDAGRPRSRGSPGWGGPCP